MVRPVWIAFVVVVALMFAGRAEAAPAVAGGPPVADACDSAVTCLRVTVVFSGEGSGRVTSSPAGIDCTWKAAVSTGKCSKTFTRDFGPLTVSFTATPEANSFVGAQTSSLTVPVGQKHTANADFTIGLIEYFVRVTKSGAGTGTVTGPGIDCGGDCAEPIKHGKPASLTATPSAGSVFKQWTGACSGQGATCNLTITDVTETNAVFEVAGQGGTTGGGTTGGATPGGGSGAGGDAADSSVDAQVIAVEVGRSRLGKRVVRLEVTANETISVELTLLRAGKTLARVKTGKLKEGERLITLPVLNAVKKGKATLQIVIADAAGNTQTVTRGVRLGKA